jgi:exopolyphosphatase/guanosine-5'-triphosphate,3'-diphosphate pyrophosphatase
VLGHRGRFSIERLQAISPQKRVPVKLVALLRLAHRLHRNRDDQIPSSLQLEIRDDALHLTFPSGWLEEHPLTRADLASERRRAGLAGLELVLS